jgi:nicotinate dehydrogenase subunit B
MKPVRGPYRVSLLAIPEVMTFPDIPEIVIELIDRPATPPWGAGEPAAAVVPSAISNAVFDATGVRLRSVPFTPAKVQAASRAT